MEDEELAILVLRIGVSREALLHRLLARPHHILRCRQVTTARAIRVGPFTNQTTQADHQRGRFLAPDPRHIWLEYIRP